MPLHCRLQLAIAIRKRSPTGTRIDGHVSPPEMSSVDLAGGHPRSIFRRALERDNLVLTEVSAREIGRVTIAGRTRSQISAEAPPHSSGTTSAID